MIDLNMDIDIDDESLQNLLVALVEQSRALASRIAGDPDRETQCHFCGGTLSLWENLLVMQLTGVAAHVRCPPEILENKLREAGPTEGFPYEEFSRAVQRRMERRRLNSLSGIIEETVVAPT
jgi:hypothetical protein